MIKLFNATMHDETPYLDAFKTLGYDVDPEPRLSAVDGPAEAYAMAKRAVAAAKGYDGMLIGGRTDVMIYIAILAPIEGLGLYIAETKRTRDANDRFVFHLAGVTPIYVEHDPHIMGAAVAVHLDVLGLRAAGADV